MKITCGFEMLVAEARREEEARPDADERKTREPTSDAAWRRFKASLVANGYFRDEMEEARCIRSSWRTRCEHLRGRRWRMRREGFETRPRDASWRFSPSRGRRRRVTDGDPGGRER